MIFPCCGGGVEGVENMIPERCIRFTLNAEGGYSNHPADRGGPTNRGVTAGTLARAIKQGIVPPVAIKELSREQAIQIYDALYWQPSRAAEMSERVGMVHFDSSVLHGLGGGAIILQRALGRLGFAVSVDGAIGPGTLGALDRADDVFSEDAILDVILATRLQRYDEIVARDPSQKVFLRGWRNRVARLAREVGR